MNTGVYKIQNTVNGKFYIGSTSWGFSNRWKSHANLLRKNKHRNFHLQSSWNKYGEPNFKFEIIEKCKKTECVLREQHYIDTLHPQYNILSKAYSALGYKHTAATKAIIGAASAGKNHPCYSGEHIFYHPSYGTFTGSIVDFGKQFRLRKSLPYKLSQGVLHKSHGWIYVGKSDSKVPLDMNSFYRSRIFNDKPTLHFIHTNGTIFIGRAAEFRKKYNLDRSTISKLVNGKRSFAFGWTIKT